MLEALSEGNFKIEENNFKNNLLSKSLEKMKRHIDNENYMPVLYFITTLKNDLLYMISLSLTYDLELIYVDGHVTKNGSDLSNIVAFQIDSDVNKLNDIRVKNCKTQAKQV